MQRQHPRPFSHSATCDGTEFLTWEQSQTLLPLSPKEHSGVTIRPVSLPPLLYGFGGKTTLLRQRNPKIQQLKEHRSVFLTKQPQGECSQSGGCFYSTQSFRNPCSSHPTGPSCCQFVTMSGFSQPGGKEGHSDLRPRPGSGFHPFHSHSDDHSLVLWPRLQGRLGNVISQSSHVQTRKRRMGFWRMASWCATSLALQDDSGLWTNRFLGSAS